MFLSVLLLCVDADVCNNMQICCPFQAIILMATITAQKMIRIAMIERVMIERVMVCFVFNIDYK